MISGLPFLLSVHGLTKRYGNTLILAGVDFDLQPGEMVTSLVSHPLTL
jgi:ABC-type multidrug transport system ATPase subunit